jgi:hypothetical protein
VEAQAAAARASLTEVRRPQPHINTTWALEFYGFAVALSTSLGGYEAELNIEQHVVLLDKKIYADHRFTRRRRFTEAHEIGHVVLKHEGLLHRETPQTIRESYFDGDGEVAAREFEANLFGAALLMPSDSFARELNRPVPELADAYGVSRAAAEMRVTQVRPGAIVSGRATLPSGRVTRLAATFELERTHPVVADAVYQLQAAIWRRREFRVPTRVLREIAPRLSKLGSLHMPIEKQRWPLNRGARVFDGAEFPAVIGDYWFIGCTDREVAFELVLS